MNVLGVDLAGPTGALNTGVVRFQVIDDRLRVLSMSSTTDRIKSC